MIPEVHFLTKVLKFTDSEASEMLEEALEDNALSDDKEEEQRLLEIEEEETRMKLASTLKVDEKPPTTNLEEQVEELTIDYDLSPSEVDRMKAMYINGVENGT